MCDVTATAITIRRGKTHIRASPVHGATRCKDECSANDALGPLRPKSHKLLHRDAGMPIEHRASGAFLLVGIAGHLPDDRHERPKRQIVEISNRAYEQRAQFIAYLVANANTGDAILPSCTSALAMDCPMSAR